MQNASTLLTILMAMAVQRYYTARNAGWMWSRAFLKATNRQWWQASDGDGDKEGKITCRHR